MIRVSAMYPAGPDTRFDLDYYLTKHTPMAQARFGQALTDTRIDQGIGGFPPGAPPAYVIQCHFTFASMEGFQAALAAHAAEIMADIPNFTNVQPVIQISEVKLG